MTLSDLRTLLTLAHGPAVERLEDRDEESLARAYLPFFTTWIWSNVTPITMLRGTSVQVVSAAMRENRDDPSESWLLLDLTDPGTVHALKVALALALGLDPGPAGADLSWSQRNMGGYILCSASHNWTFDAHEPDPIKALVLACQHVIRGKP